MIKRQQKWIALLVTLTFMWLLQVSTMPLAASNTTEQVGSANEEHAPSYIEQEGSAASHAPKKSILPVILIGVGVAAVAAVLYLVVFKTKYDIVGAWTGTETYTGSPTTYHYVFTGDKKSGTLKITSLSGTSTWDGTYTVDGKNVTMTLTNYSYVVTFDSKTTMKGDIYYKGDKSGTFAATKD